MGHQNQRLALTMEPELKRAYETTAKAMGIPASRLIVQILEQSKPMVLQMGKAVFNARSDSEPQLVIRGESPNEEQLDLEDQIASKRKK